MPKFYLPWYSCNKMSVMHSNISMIDMDENGYKIENPIIKLNYNNGVGGVDSQRLVSFPLMRRYFKGHKKYYGTTIQEVKKSI